MGNLKVDRLRYPVQFRPFSTKAREHNCSRAFVFEEGDQKVFCSPSSGLPNPRRLTSATPIRGISRPGAVPSGLFSQRLT